MHLHVICSGLWLVGMFCNHKMHNIWSVDSQESYYNCCHQMSDFKAKMHLIRFPPAGGAYSAPPEGAYSAPPDP